MNILAPLVLHRTPSSANRVVALEDTRAWIRQHVATVREFVRLKEADEANFQPWLNWSVRHAWVEHASRRAGLFDEQFLPEVAKALEVAEGDLRALLVASRNEEKVRLWARRQAGEQFELARRAYVLSALYRGRFHDSVARLEGRQILHHPLRRNLFSMTEPDVFHGPFIPSPVEECLARMLIQIGWRERGLAARASRWASNLMLVRQQLGVLKPSALEASTASQAASRAADIAYRSGIKVEPKWIEAALNLSVAFGAAAIAHFTLAGWLKAGLTEGGAHLLNVGSRVAKMAVTKHRLRRLAQAGPGRIQASW